LCGAHKLKEDNQGVFDVIINTIYNLRLLSWHPEQIRHLLKRFQTPQGPNTHPPPPQKRGLHISLPQKSTSPAHKSIPLTPEKISVLHTFLPKNPQYINHSKLITCSVGKGYTPSNEKSIPLQLFKMGF
jgi:hypothetical protein